ncbi:MaoC family dehydratase N-terminal domain-containing protein [Leucobacter denitrificans]|uniref:MaoC family dehydratase N-terminal domain-containing protein n=2 Tax=Leucobacter denitrificans TaxID=683042 RepID=A0A7G9S7I2_9MICO|nr:MaoC family dehydratase N-terminal domain-containing protein [Leucobacter denitrificans]
MHNAVGTEISRRVSYPVSDSDIRRWALATYWPASPPKRYLSTDTNAVVAPEDFNPFAWAVVDSRQHPDAVDSDQNDPDSTEKQIGVEGPGLKFMLNGGMVATYSTAIRPGDTITSVNRLSSYTERTSRLGQMLITVLSDEWTNQHGDVVKRVDTTLLRY